MPQEASLAAKLPPRVLLVSKTSNFELHGHRVEAHVHAGHVPREQLRRLQQAHEEHYASLNAVKSAFQGASIPFTVMHRDDPWPDAGSFDVVVTVGGDGTLLLASHRLPMGGRMVGVRSSPSSVGHLCAFDGEDAEALATQLRQQSLVFHKIPRLCAKVYCLETQATVIMPPALNDCLFANISPAATTRYNIQFDGKREFHKSSGIWFATAIGSTAAIHAAGGTVLPPETRQLQFMVRELYQGAKQPPLSLRHAVFDPDQKQLLVECRSQQAMLAVDGPHGVQKLGFGDRLTLDWGADIHLVFRGHDGCLPG